MIQGALRCFHRTYLFMSLQNLLTFWIRQNSSLVKLIHQISLQIIYSTLLLLYQCHLKHNSFNNEEKDYFKPTTTESLLFKEVNVWDNQNFVGLLGRNFKGNWFVALQCATIIIYYFAIHLWGRKFVGKNKLEIHEQLSSTNNDNSTAFHLHALIVCNTLLHKATVSK